MLSNNKQSFSTNKGQALVTLLAFVATATIIIAGAVVVTISNIQGSSQYSLGETALMVAEAGAEDALIRLLRDPNFGGSTVLVGNYNAQVTVTTNGNIKTIDSVGVVGNFRRKVNIQADYSNNLTINNWREVDY